MVRTIWGDPERYKKTYYPDDFKGKLYLAGDGASTDEEGYFRIVGRIDDVLNVSGHRLGTMEIESALVSNTKLVAEAAVVGRPDDLTGEAVCAFVVLKVRARTATMRTGSPRNCAIGWRRKLARLPGPRTSASVTTCRKRARARSCVACLDRSQRAKKSRRMYRRWKTRQFWSNSRLRYDDRRFG